MFHTVSDAFNVDVIMDKKVNLQDHIPFLPLMENLWKNTAQLDVVQKFMNDPDEKFDVVVAEWLYDEFVSG